MCLRRCSTFKFKIQNLHSVPKAYEAEKVAPKVLEAERTYRRCIQLAGSLWIKRQSSRYCQRDANWIQERIPAVTRAVDGVQDLDDYTSFEIVDDAALP